MKIHNVIRLAYTNSEPLYLRLAEDVKDRLKAPVEGRRWFYLYRVKTLESFAMKIETGRVPNPDSLEDFFACTIVVPTISELAQAEALVHEYYDPVERKPGDPKRTHKRSSSFDFDDLRLYVKRRPDRSGADQDLDALVFEVQVKTVLQYAWSVATHDLIYKTDSVSWTKERIAYQVKAMLEHAELAISEATALAEAQGFQKQDDRTKEIADLIKVILEVWPEEMLPTDMKRLAENVFQILKVVKIQPAVLYNILKKEIVRNGILPSDLSPYAFIVQALANTDDIDLNAKLRADRRLKVLIHYGMDLPEWCMKHPQFILIRQKL